MYIVLVILRDIVVEYRLNIIDIDTAGSHIGCNQDLGASVAETVHNTVTLYLL